MKKHTIILGSLGSGKSSTGRRLLGEYPEPTAEVHSIDDFKQILKGKPETEAILINELTLRNFNNPEFQSLCKQTITRIRRPYAKNMEERSFPILIIIVNATRDQLPEEMRRFEVIDLNTK